MARPAGARRGRDPGGRGTLGLVGRFPLRRYCRAVKSTKSTAARALLIGAALALGGCAHGGPIMGWKHVKTTHFDPANYRTPVISKITYQKTDWDIMKYGCTPEEASVVGPR